jgi:hypothetical protein
MTVRQPPTAPLARGAGLRDALRASREALTDLQVQLDALLTAVRAPTTAMAVATAEKTEKPARALADCSVKKEAIDRLAGATRRASAAIGNLSKA